MYSPNKHVLAVVLMTASASIMPIGDSVAKYLSAIYPVLFISFCRYFSGLLLLFPIAVTRFEYSAISLRMLSAQLIHSVFLVLSIALFFASLKQISLVNALGLYFLSPIVATLLSFLLLNEQTSLKKIISICGGFLGAVLIIKPGVSLNVGSLYGLGAGLSFSGYIVMTRLIMQKRTGSTVLLMQYTIGTILLLPFALNSIPHIGLFEGFLLLTIGAVSLVSHGLQVKAFKLAPVSLLSPLVYVEIISALGIGYFLFEEFPDTLTLVGVLIICASGLLLVFADRMPSLRYQSLIFRRKRV